MEAGGGSGTRDSHWRESVFTSELMTGWASGGLQMSRVTIGSLADIGYIVNMNAADAFTPSSTATGFLVAGSGSSTSLRSLMTTPQSVFTTNSTSYDHNAVFAVLNNRSNSASGITTLTRSNSAITTLTSLTRTNTRLSGPFSHTTSNGLGQRVASSAALESDNACVTSESASQELIFGDNTADWRA